VEDDEEQGRHADSVRCAKTQAATRKAFRLILAPAWAIDKNDNIFIESFEMSTDAKAMVEKFLSENGYPFEMRVAKEFKKNGFGVGQSIYFPDPNTQITREIDLVAVWHKTMYNQSFNVIILIECKFAKTPWILFSSLTDGYDMCYSHNEKGKRWLNHLVKEPYFKHFFEVERHVGYGLTASSKESEPQKDNAYKAIQTLISFLKSEISIPKFSREGYTLFIPIIAIKGKLFDAHLNNENEIVCNEIKEGQLFYNEGLSEIVPKIHIITEDVLTDYVLRMQEDIERLFISPYTDISITNPSLSELDNRTP
jgi:hypothetical protein